MAAVNKKSTVRILCSVVVDGVAYPSGTPLELPQKSAKVLIDAGVADDHPSAVEYALSESGGVCVVHLGGEVPAADGDKDVDVIEDTDKTN